MSFVNKEDERFSVNIIVVPPGLYSPFHLVSVMDVQKAIFFRSYICFFWVFGVDIVYPSWHWFLLEKLYLLLSSEVKTIIEVTSGYHWRGWVHLYWYNRFGCNLHYALSLCFLLIHSLSIGWVEVIIFWDIIIVGISSHSLTWSSLCLD